MPLPPPPPARPRVTPWGSRPTLEPPANRPPAAPAPNPMACASPPGPAPRVAPASGSWGGAATCGGSPAARRCCCHQRATSWGSRNSSLECAKKHWWVAGKDRGAGFGELRSHRVMRSPKPVHAPLAPAPPWESRRAGRRAAPRRSCRLIAAAGGASHQWAHAAQAIAAQLCAIAQRVQPALCPRGGRSMRQRQGQRAGAAKGGGGCARRRSSSSGFDAPVAGTAGGRRRGSEAGAVPSAIHSTTEPNPEPPTPARTIDVVCVGACICVGAVQLARARLAEVREVVEQAGVPAARLFVGVGKSAG